MCCGFVLATSPRDVFQAMSQLPRRTVQTPDTIKSRADVRRSHSCSQLTLPCLGLGGSEVM